MPDGKLYHPDSMFGGGAERDEFKRRVKLIIARNMDAINPYKGKMTNYADDPDGNIGLLLIPYSMGDGSDIWTLL